MVLADNPQKRAICPVTLFLGLAIADGAIEGITEIADIYKVKGVTTSTSPGVLSFNSSTPK
jgi:hypothetical protein